MSGGIKRSKIIDSEDIYVSLNNPFSSQLSKKSSLRIDDETVIDHKLIRNINFDLPQDENFNEFSVFSFDLI